MNKTLLLNDNFRILAFIDERKALKLIIKDKAEIVSTWEGKKIYYPSGFIQHPATIRMKYHISLKPTKAAFSRKLIFRRDNYSCGYCGLKFNSNQLTIDHILPKSLGGANSFTNCVSACITCNQLKKNRTPADANMVLKIKPKAPSRYVSYLPPNAELHDDWLFFI